MAKKKTAIGKGIGLQSFVKVNLVILPELEALIPPLNETEAVLLEDSLKSEGLKEPIEYWQSGDKQIVVDGHNRKKICEKNSIPLKTKEKQFKSLDEVKEYMLKKQLGRRNLTDANRTYLIGLLYNNSKVEKGKYERTKEPLTSTSEPAVKKDTAREIAEKHGTSERSVKNAGDFVEGLEKVAPELKKDILSGKQKVNKGDIQKLSKTNTKEKVKTAKEIESLVNDSQKKKNNSSQKSKRTQNSVNGGKIPKSEQEPQVEISHYVDEIIQIIQPNVLAEDKISNILSGVVERLAGELSLSGSDVQKLAKAGYTLLRADDQPNIRIKKIDKNNLTWVTLEKDFTTKAERNRRLKELLHQKKSIKA